MQRRLLSISKKFLNPHLHVCYVQEIDYFSGVEYNYNPKIQVVESALLTEFKSRETA